MNNKFKVKSSDVEKHRAGLLEVLLEPVGEPGHDGALDQPVVGRPRNVGQVPGHHRPTLVKPRQLLDFPLTFCQNSHFLQQKSVSVMGLRLENP